MPGQPRRRAPGSTPSTPAARVHTCRSRRANRVMAVVRTLGSSSVSRRPVESAVDTRLSVDERSASERRRMAQWRDGCSRSRDGVVLAFLVWQRVTQLTHPVQF